jgi:hypothetical protein
MENNMALTPEYRDFVMQLSDEKIERLFADMGIEIDLNGPSPVAFEDVEQDIIDSEFADDEGILFDEF